MTKSLIPTIIVLAVILHQYGFASAPEKGPFRGLILPFYAYEIDRDYTPYLREIASTGATHVGFVYAEFIAHSEASIIYPLPHRTPCEKVLSKTLTTAKELGLKTFFLPIVLLEDSGEGEWRGSINPTDLKLWFENYRQLIIPLAEMANQHQVEMFSVGSEFSSLEVYSKEWEYTIDEIRKVFKGRLLYTANWDSYDEITWWDKVDIVGISAYYELTDNPDASLEELEVSWRLFQRRIHRLTQEVAPDKPYIFCEIGYPSIDGGAVYPWDYTQKTEVDLWEQRYALEAFLNVWEDDPTIYGWFIYSWYDFHEKPNRSYSIRGKPAEGLIRSRYRKSIP